MTEETLTRPASGPIACAPSGERDVVVRVEALKKRFGDVAAVDGVSFSIAEGEIFGLLGPNGAGKTTTISMISGLLAPDDGDVVVAGKSVRKDSLAVRAELGVVPQEIALYPTLTARENLKFWGRMYGMGGKQLDAAVDDGLALAGLEDKAKKRVETFSGGMKRRINIAAGVLHRPRVLLMDEPTVGIDPQSRNHILDTVRELNRAGMTVLYTSHYMEEVEALCDRIAIVDHGRVIACGTLDELRALVGDEDVVRVTLGGSLVEEEAAASTPPAQAEQPDENRDQAVSPLAAAAAVAIGALPDVSKAEARGVIVEALTPDAGRALAGIVEAVTGVGASVRSLEVVEPDLESVFLHLTGRGLRD